MLNSEVLVLNKSFQPVNVINVKRGLTMLYAGIAHALDEQYQIFDFESWSELSSEAHAESIGTVAGKLRIPRVLVLQLYNRVPAGRIRFSRRNIYARDGYTCQYCGKHGRGVELNLDHVIPKSQGGATTWENVVCSCVKCNTRKGGRTPQQAKMRLRQEPVRPVWNQLGQVPSVQPRHTQWEPFLNPVDASYWNTELLNQ